MHLKSVIFLFISNLNPVQIVTVNLYREADIKKKKKDKNTKIGMITLKIIGVQKFHCHLEVIEMSM